MGGEAGAAAVGVVALEQHRLVGTAQSFRHELVDSIIGDNYPVPDRMLVHNERIVHEYLMWAVCGHPRPAGKFDLYAVEGGTVTVLLPRPQDVKRR